MLHLTRRRWLRATGAGGMLGLGVQAIGQPVGANDAVRVAVIGLRGRGQSHLASIAAHEGMRLGAICDVDPAVLGQNVERLGKRQRAVAAFADVRKLLEALQEHLARNGVELSGPVLALGAPLTMGPVSERFVDNEAANQLLHPPYRPPCVMPEVL